MQSATALLPLLGDSGTLHLTSCSPGSTGRLHYISGGRKSPT